MPFIEAETAEASLMHAEYLRRVRRDLKNAINYS